MKNLALYNAEQTLRLTGIVIDTDRSHLFKPNTTTVVAVSNHIEPAKTNGASSNREVDEFFQNSDSSSMTAESQALLDEMFSS